MTILKPCLAALALLAPMFCLSSCNHADAATGQLRPAPAEAQDVTKEKAILIQYLEIVTPDVDATCSALAKVHGVTFGEPDAGFGNARTAALEGGGWIGVRAPMAEHDKPVVRPYALVDDIEAAVKAVEEAGGELGMGATEIPGRGKFAIYFSRGTQFGLWETPTSTVPAVPAEEQEATPEKAMLIQYLEIVTPDVDATCSALAKVHGVTFGEPDAGLGNARTAALEGGGRIGVRASMAEHDKPVVRPYALVGDIEAGVKAVEAAGGELAMGATEIPGQGKFAIYFFGGTQFGLWETTVAKASR
ncbi:MAG: putative enzyme related to lactoylglutathione lyase [Pseudohongiellaceae bacterium]|jgi:predicted enzyme related to lactoylglutathione lyase